MMIIGDDDDDNENYFFISEWFGLLNYRSKPFPRGRQRAKLVKSNKHLKSNLWPPCLAISISCHWNFVGILETFWKETRNGSDATLRYKVIQRNTQQ